MRGSHSDRQGKGAALPQIPIYSLPGYLIGRGISILSQQASLLHFGFPQASELEQDGSARVGECKPVSVTCGLKQERNQPMLYGKIILSSYSSTPSCRISGFSFATTSSKTHLYTDAVLVRAFGGILKQIYRARQKIVWKSSRNWTLNRPHRASYTDFSPIKQAPATRFNFW